MGQILCILRTQQTRIKRTEHITSRQRKSIVDASASLNGLTVYQKPAGNTTIPLPLELIDAIIDLIAQDKCTLYSCNLASRQLGISVKRYIFRDVTLGRHNTNKFLAFFRFNPHLGHCVRKLTMVGATGGPESASANLVESYKFIFPHFIYLTELCLSRYQFPLGHSAMWRLILTEFPVIHHMSLVSCTFSSCDDILQLVAAHSSLSRLDLWRVETCLDVMQTSRHTTGSIHSRGSIGLEIKAVSSLDTLTTLSRAFRNADVHIPLETLILSNISEGDGEIINTILSLLGECLKHLQLDIATDATVNQAEGILKTIILSENTRLKTVCLPLHMRLMTFGDRPSIQGVSFGATPRLISTSASPDLIALTLRLYCYKGGGIRELVVIDDLITEARFGKLLYLCFEFIGCPKSGGYFAKIEEALPKAFQRGLLTFAR